MSLQTEGEALGTIDIVESQESLGLQAQYDLDMTAEQIEMLEVLVEEVGPFRRSKLSDAGLKLSLDRKTSTDGYLQKSINRWVAKNPNSFGLPAGDTCPGKTDFCKSCYADNSSNRPDVRANLEHNQAIIDSCETVEEIEVYLTAMMIQWDMFAQEKEVAEKDRIFRWHWSGDFHTAEYTEAAVRTMSRFSDVQFWCYTRSFTDEFDVIPTLSQVPNLQLYLSVDDENAEAAEKYPDVLKAFCAEDYRRGHLLNNSERKARPCPENSGKMPLMRNARGACADCRWCIDGKTDIIFALEPEFDAVPQMAFAMDIEERPIQSVAVKLAPRRTVISGTARAQRLPGFEEET